MPCFDKKTKKYTTHITSCYAAGNRPSPQGGGRGFPACINALFDVAARHSVTPPHNTMFADAKRRRTY